MNRAVYRAAALIVVVFFSILVGGCATTPYDEDQNDPLEPMNRAFFKFNDALDRAIVYPVADAYATYIPGGLRTSISNFFSNLVYPGVVANDFLQGKIEQGFEDTGRFIVNSTFGVGGLFDLATPVGLSRHQEDFGQTLCVWGFEEGAYLMLPLLGPNTVRDLPDQAVSLAANVFDVTYYFDIDTIAEVSMSGLDIVDTRSRLPSPDDVDRVALDPYIYIRSAYRQRREYLCYDGNPPVEDFNEFNDLDNEFPEDTEEDITPES